MRTRQELIEDAARRLARSGFEVAILSVRGDRHGRAFGWCDLLAAHEGQRAALLVCVTGPGRDHKDPLPLILSSASAKAWLTAKGQIEIWRCHPKTRAGRDGEVTRQPIRLESLDKPDTRQPALSWAEAFGHRGAQS
jgi:hypothetical protein